MLRSCGFNTTLANTNTTAGFKLRLDTDWALINHEYDADVAEGSMQLVVADRFLVEIQLDQLPQESFELALARQVSLDRLIGLAGGGEE